MKYKVLRDPCGILCMFLTYACVVFVDWCLVREVILPTLKSDDDSSVWGSVHVVLFNTLLFMLAYSHLRATFTDPGWVPLPKVPIDFSNDFSHRPDDEWTLCKHCEMFRPPRAHHCRVCRKCVRKMDHHCPWINSCVGERNQKYFLLFLLYTGVAALYAIILTASSWTVTLPYYTADEKRTRKISLVILLSICALFCVFVTSIMYDQLYSICQDVTGVESVKKRNVRPHKSKLEIMKETCGRGSYIKWFIPCSSSHLTTDYRPNYDV